MTPSGLNGRSLSTNGSTVDDCTRGRSDVGGRRTCRAPVRSTGDRVLAAWRHARPFARRSLIAACATSVALVGSLRTPAIVAGTTATVGVLLAVAALVDVHERRLPNRLLAAGCAFALAGALLSSDSTVAIDAVLGLILAAGVMLCVRLTRGVGMGDVKMAAVVGASAGACTTSLLAPATAIAIAALAGATYGFIANRQRVPFGPSLWFGWAATIALAAFVAPMGWPS